VKNCLTHPNPSLLGREGRTRSAGVSSKTKALPKFGRAFGILLFTCQQAGHPLKGRMGMNDKLVRKSKEREIIKYNNIIVLDSHWNLHHFGGQVSS